MTLSSFLILIILVLVVRLLQRNRINKIYMCIYVYTYMWMERGDIFKIGSHNRGDASPKSAGWASRLETQRSTQRQSAGKTPSSSREVNIFLMRPSIDWMRPTHIFRTICFIQSLLNLNVNSIQKSTFTVSSRIMFNQISRHCGLAKLTQN